MTFFSKNISLFFFFLLLSLIIIVLDHFILLNWLKSSTEKIFNPIKLQIFNFKQSFWSNFSPTDDPVILSAKIDYLSVQNALLQTEIDNLLEENEALKKQINAPVKIQKNLLPARNIATLNGIMTLNKGIDDGVKEGQVVVSEGVLVGRIILVSPFSSRVQLASEENSRIKVKIVSLKEKGLLKGTPEGRILLTEVLQKADLKEGLVVASTGEEGIYPADLPIGKIERIIKDDVAIYKQAEVKPLVDYNNLKVVMVRI
jgi:rod shape-determining protein MreC